MTDKPPPRPSRPPPRPVTAAPPLPKRPAPVVGGAAGPPPPIPRPPPRTAPVARASAASGEDATKLFAGNTLQEAELRVVKGAHVGTTVALGAGTVVIGRSSECELSLKGGQGVSRRHCKVQYVGDRFVVIDLESRNGTIVNGQSVERKVLERGDRIEIGDETVEFVVETLDDLRAAPIGDGSIEDAQTALLPQAASRVAPPDERTGDRRPAPPPQPDRFPLPATLPPQRASADDDDLEPLPPPPMPANPELSSPYVHQPPAESRSKAPLIFGLLTLLVVLCGGFLVYDVWFKTDGPAPDNVVATADDGTAATDPTVNDQAAGADAGSVSDAGAGADAVVVVDAGVVEVAVDAGVGAAHAAVVVDAGVAQVEAADAGAATVDAAARVVRATVAGRATEVRVKVGSVIKKGDVIVIVTDDNGSLERKAQALRREEREFAEVAKKVPSAKADLDEVRAELRRVEFRLKPQSQTAAEAGVVVEVLVEVGGIVRSGAPIITIR